ncbi:MAG: formyltransferase family protein [Candidatus Nomurabacteria bacterium]|nr:formyltransferase family protein [Candidatus Nomurabacteria bacterium]
MKEGALLFYDENFIKEKTPERPLKIVFMTSLRDIALEERNGQFLNINGIDRYVKGVIESTLEETAIGGILEGLIEVKGVIYDDTLEDLKGEFPLFPSDNDSWIFPTKLLPEDSIWNIPSLFRKLSKDDVKGRKEAKYNFELSVFQKIKEVEADVLILDSYMAKIEYLFKFMPDRVINIHPGPTLINKPFCFRGKAPYFDAILFARENGGPVYTGATLHFVNEKFDDGRFIAYICNTPVDQEEDWIILMYKNYISAKIPIFIAGLRHYVLKIIPYL